MTDKSDFDYDVPKVAEAARKLTAALRDAMRFVPAMPKHDPNRHRLDAMLAALAAAKAAGIEEAKPHAYLVINP